MEFFGEYSEQEIHSCLLDLCWPIRGQSSVGSPCTYFTIKGTHRWGSNSRFANARDKVIFAVDKGSVEPYSAAKKSAVQDCAECVGDSKWTALPPIENDPDNRQTPPEVLDEMFEKFEKWIKVIKKTHRSPSRSPARSKSPQKSPFQSPAERVRPTKIDAIASSQPFKSEVRPHFEESIIFTSVLSSKGSRKTSLLSLV